MPLPFSAPDSEIVISVDLTWTLWNTDPDVWEDHSPGTLQRLRLAFNGQSPPITVDTRPREECRRGKVTIARGRAMGWFAISINGLGMADLGIECDTAFLASISWSTLLGRPGIDRDLGRIRSRTFEGLMKKICAQEDMLFDESSQVSERLDSSDEFP